MRSLPEQESEPSSTKTWAWREIYECYFDGTYRFICRCGIPASEVEDLVQSVFLRAFQRLRGRAEANTVQNMRAWLCGIALRIVSEHRRWGRVRHIKQWLLCDVMGFGGKGPATPEELSDAHETQRMVGEILQRMSPKLREVLILRDIDDRDLDEVALMLGIPQNTVRSRIRLAREKFEEIWNDKGWGDKGAGKEASWT
jgi:RNA polymerase sigma factor (sigma-70 family)